MTTKSKRVIVVGSGSGALVAANVAAAEGAEVTVLERASVLGGGSAMSTGLVFAPGNKWMRSVGVEDSADEGVRYYEQMNGGMLETSRIARYVDSTLAMTEWVDAETPLEFIALKGLPDFHPQLPSGRSGGRHLAVRPFTASELGTWADRTRRAPSPLLSFHEIDEAGGPSMARNFDRELVRTRVVDDVRTQGAAIIAGLVAGALARGVELITGARVRRLITDDGAVTGVEYEDEAGATLTMTGDAVILGTGGYEWNAEMNRRTLRGRLTGPLSAPTNEGDGHVMGASVGAAFALMHESVWVPVTRIPGETYDGKPKVRNLAPDKGRAHSIIVNRAGERFVNESLNYYDMVHGMLATDLETYDAANVPAYLVFDSAYRELYPVGDAWPGDPTPPWVAESDSAAGLAAQLRIDATGLERTLSRFNRMAAAGVDEDFGRGNNDFDRYYGDPSVGPNPSLGTVQNPPYFAIPLEVGTFGNRGGMVGTDSGQVVDTWDRPIPGLYACGNARAQLVNGRGYEGGATLAQSMTFGFAAARHIMGSGDE